MIDHNIVGISKVKTEQLSEFYKRVFKNRNKILTNHWQWWYRSNYLGYEPIVLISNNKVVGQAGLIPTKIRIEKEILPAIWFIDFAVLPEYQNQGLGKILTKEWMNICPNQITFCNDYSLNIFKKFGWSTNFNTKRLARPIDPTRWIPLLNKFRLNIFSSIYKNSLKKKFSNINAIDPYPIKSNYEILADSFKKRKSRKTTSPEILRDEDWLNWRLMKCPFNKNIYFFEYKENFAVIHIITTANIKRLHILYSYYVNNPEEEKLFRLIFKWALNNSIDLVWANSNDERLIKKFEKILPNHFSKPMNFASWSSDKEMHKKLQLGLTNSQGIDSDNDIISFDENYF
jgi:GNAT superfamily N-acetyltransferase|tara:strand:- start:1741 stop:2772 length:1032 start_codon:yes stop_codon:yes gene_type:complete